MSAPQRIQCSRLKGYKMPPNTVRVARPSKWGNPFVIGIHGDAQTCVKLYQEKLLRYSHKHGSMVDFLTDCHTIEEIRRELGGKNLACYCPLHSPCHADVLLKIANGKEGV